MNIAQVILSEGASFHHFFKNYSMSDRPESTKRESGVGPRSGHRKYPLLLPYRLFAILLAVTLYWHDVERIKCGILPERWPSAAFIYIPGNKLRFGNLFWLQFSFRAVLIQRAALFLSQKSRAFHKSRLLYYGHKVLPAVYFDRKMKLKRPGSARSR